MQQTLISIGILAGGLGLFLLAMSMITDGLTRAAGHALRDLLGKWTRTPARGIVTGLSITAIVQSSSAVTVAMIGFVNAGLLTIRRIAGVVEEFALFLAGRAFLRRLFGLQRMTAV